MATDIEQGVKYTLEAEDKATPVIEKAGKAVADNAKKASDSAIRGFSPMSALSSALRGDFAAMGGELSKLIPKFQELGKRGEAALGLAAAAIYGIINLAKELKALLETVFNTKAISGELKTANHRMAELNSKAVSFAERMNEARETSSRMAKEFEENAAAINKMTKAQNEFARAQELSIAKTKEEKDAINRRYDRLNAGTDADMNASIGNNRLSYLKDEEERLKEELKNARTLQKEYTKTANRLGESGRERRSGSNLFSDIFTNFFTGASDTKYAESSFKGSFKAQELAQEQAERISEIEKKLEENRHAQKMANITLEAQEVESLTRHQTEMNVDNDIEEERRRLDLEKNIAEERRAADEEEKRRRQEMAAEEFRIRTEQKKALAQARDEYNSNLAEQRSAEARVAAAQSAVRQAWGWYRDKDAMKAQIEEEKANAAAERQFEKDFDKLTFRRDWRTAKNLTVDQEAVRRVGLAREEEAAAKKAATETAENTARIATEVEKITKVLEES